MENQMTLSEAEVLIIQAERAKAEAAKAEAEAKEAIQIKDAITSAQKRHSNDLKEVNAHYQATINYYNEIKSITPHVTLDVEDRILSTKPYYYKRNDNESKCIELEPIISDYKQTTLKVMGYEIKVARHDVYDYHRLKSSNFEMQIYHLYDNRYYKKASTVVSKIIEIKTKKEAKQQREDARETAKKDAFNDVTQQYPHVEVRLDKDYYRSGKNDYTEWDVLNITFNGNKAQYRIYSNTPTTDNPKTYKLSFVKMVPAKTSLDEVISKF